MRWMFAGVLVTLAAACAAAGVRDDAPVVVRSIPLNTMRVLVFDGTSRLHILPPGAGDEVRIEGPAASVSKVTVKQRGDEVVVAGAPADVDVYVRANLQSVRMGEVTEKASGAQCRIAVSGDARAHLDNIVARTIEIYVDGAGRLDVGKMTAATVATNLDGNAAVRSGVN
ncbi:MAG TPA: hypothetical protein VJ998_02760 [Pseudomonadales bacterium]|nr:hypothetical protein [Pseudomonadales bacterium]